MAISIRDVAVKAGVSVGTVSHVLNANQAARIAAETQERVRRAASDLGYRPNRVARSLGRRRTDTMGVLIGGLRNPFFVEALETIEVYARDKGYRVFLEAAPSRHGTFAGHAPPLDYWPVDGMLVWSPPDETIAEILGSPYSGMPVVYLGAEREDDTDWVAFDYEAGGRLAAERLLRRGCRRPAYVTPYAYGIDRHEDSRHVGFDAALRERGVKAEMLLTNEEETRAAGLRVGERIAALPPAERPDGLFCHNDMVAIGVCCGLRRGGVRIPEAVAVIGHDGVEEGLYLETPLTTVELPVAELCRRGVDALAQRLNPKNADAKAENGVLLAPALRDGGTA